MEHQAVELVLETLGLLLRQLLELAFLLHLAQLLQPFDSLLHGAEVRQHAAHPAAVDEVHAAARGLGLDRLLRLLLGAHEEHRPPARGHASHEIPGVVEKPHRFLQVDDVDAVAGGEDVGLHLRIPAAGLMSEVDARLQQLLQGHLSHVSTLPPCSSSARDSAFTTGALGAGHSNEGQGHWPGRANSAAYDWRWEYTQDSDF